MATVYLVSCVSKKQNCEAAAEELYISNWFKKAKTFALLYADAWYILSAKYGLVRPTERIQPYEQTLNAMPRKVRLNWTEQVLSSIVANTAKGDHIVFLAGTRYRELLTETLIQLGYTVDVPLANKGIGEQLSWLGRQAKNRQ
jgi:cytoplasmic iron level regulating protein YaaA (DUF328/UPF0246 family)